MISTSPAIHVPSRLTSGPVLTRKSASVFSHTQPHFAKKTYPAEAGLARAFQLFFIMIAGTMGFVATGGAKLIHNHVGMAPAHHVVQGAVDEFQAKKDRPSHGKAQLSDLLESVQQEVGKISTTPDTLKLMDTVPTLSKDELKFADSLLFQAREIHKTSQLMPLFDQWMVVLENHTAEPIDKAQVRKDVSSFFKRMQGHETVQNVLFYAMLASLGILGTGVYKFARDVY